MKNREHVQGLDSGTLLTLRGKTIGGFMLWMVDGFGFGIPVAHLIFLKVHFCARGKLRTTEKSGQDVSSISISILLSVHGLQFHLEFPVSSRDVLVGRPGILASHRLPAA